MRSWAPHKTGIVTQTYNMSTQEAEVGKSVQGHSIFQVKLEKIKVCLKQTKICSICILSGNLLDFICLFLVYCFCGKRHAMKLINRSMLTNRHFSHCVRFIEYWRKATLIPIYVYFSFGISRMGQNCPWKGLKAVWFWSSILTLALQVLNHCSNILSKLPLRSWCATAQSLCAPRVPRKTVPREFSAKCETLSVSAVKYAAIQPMK